MPASKFYRRSRILTLTAALALLAPLGPADSSTAAPGAASASMTAAAPSAQQGESEPVTPALSLEAQGHGIPAGDTVPVVVTVENSGKPPLAGDISATVPEGWQAEPQTAEYGRLSGGDSELLIFEVTVPEDTTRGRYAVDFVATSHKGTATATAWVDVDPITVSAVRASGEATDLGHPKEYLVDGDPRTKWFTYEPTGWVEFELSESFPVAGYSLMSANDYPGRDPRDWTLSGSNDGETWTELDARTDQDFTERFQTKDYEFGNTTSYRHYRIDITANNGHSVLQLAELILSTWE